MAQSEWAFHLCCPGTFSRKLFFEFAVDKQ
jgi:hypothetical protein